MQDRNLLQNKKIGFIGAGQMATALAAGLVASGTCRPEQICASDPSPAARERFTAQTSASAVAENKPVAAEADLIILAVKPAIVSQVAAELAPVVSNEKLIVSIAAGIPLKKLDDWIGQKGRLVRVMPNTPCLVSAGASAFALGPRTQDDDAALVRELLSAVGYTVRVEEPLLDAVTGLSGSGPAFVYLIIEALADAGVRVGLPRNVALELAAHTVRGAAQMVLATEEHPAMLKDKVASPGGTTIAGLQQLEERAVRGAIIAAVVAATKRAQELSGK